MTVRLDCSHSDEARPWSLSRTCHGEFRSALVTASIFAAAPLGLIGAGGAAVCSPWARVRLVRVPVVGHGLEGQISLGQLFLSVVPGPAWAAPDAATSTSSAEIVRTRSRIIVLLRWLRKRLQTLPPMSSERAMDPLRHHAAVKGPIATQQL